MSMNRSGEQPMAEFRALLGELSTRADIADREDLRVLALGASGRSADDPLDVIGPVELMKSGPLPGDLLVRRAPAEGIDYLGVIAGDYVGTADALAARGVTVEAAGPGLYVEVAEVPFGGGDLEFSARRITDPWGRDPRGQAIYRPRSQPSTQGYDDHGEELFEAEELARHAAYRSRGAWSDRAPTLDEAAEHGARPAVLTSAQLRRAWSSYVCAEDQMTPLRLFGRWNTLVNPETVDAWRAFEQALVAAGYQPHRAWVYNCRQIAGQNTRSLHAYGLAIDIDDDAPTCNVNRPTADGREVRFSAGDTKDERCHDVRRGVADTSFTADQIAAVQAIQTVDGYQVFTWGGRWRTTKNTMHFQINVTPAELAHGIRTQSPPDSPLIPMSENAEQAFQTPLEDTETKVTVPDWAKAIKPFPAAPALDFTTTDAKMTTAFANVTGNNPTSLCVALVDLTGNPVRPPYAGVNDQDMLYTGSMMKIGALYAAFALKKQVQVFLDTAAANKASTAAADIFPIIDAVWRPTVKALFLSRPEQPFNLKQNIVVPQLGTIFDVAAGKASFKSAPSTTDKDIDFDGEFSAPGRFAEWMRSMTRWSSNLATSKVVDALGYFYLNGALADAGFFIASSATDGKGLWLSADYEGHDWVTTAADKKVNAAGPKLTKRWADAQLDDGRPRVRGNLTATAFQTAKLMTLMATDKLIDADSSQKMRALLASAILHIASSNADGIGSYLKDALCGDGRTFDALQAKKGWGNDKFSHECGIVERTVGGKKLRYVAVVLGSAPAQGRADLSATAIRLDDAIIARNS